jgi:molybdopterin converting factor small subunit
VKTPTGMEITMVTLRIPTPLRSYTGGQGEIHIQGSTVGEAMNDLTAQFPSLRPHLFSEDGRLRSFVNLFLNDEDIRHLQGTGTLLKEGDRLMLIPSIAGGAD